MIDDTGVPPVAAWATLEWLLTYPAAQPATLDVEPVDVLNAVIDTVSRAASELGVERGMKGAQALELMMER